MAINIGVEIRSLVPEMEVADRQLFGARLRDDLETQVGSVLADQMTDEQLDDFQSYFDAKDDSGAFAWLNENFPNYQEIVFFVAAGLLDGVARRVRQEDLAMRARLSRRT